MPTFVDRNLTGFPGLNIRSSAGVIRFETPDLAWTTTTGHRVLFANAANNLIWDNGTTQITLASATGVATTWEQIYANDATLAMSATGMTMSQSGNAMVLTLTKTGTGAGDALVINNAGTGNDISIVVTDAGSTGVSLDYWHNSATPATNDVIFVEEFNANDSAAVSTEYARFRILATDVTDTSEDASMEWALFVAGTQRTCLTLTGPTMTIGDGASNATLTTSGALDLIISTNAGTNSGTIRIYDGVNGNIELLNDGTGDVTIPTSGIVQGGTTPTRCTFSVGGTIGDGFLIASSSITTGDVLAVDHTSAATLAGGNLLNLLVASTSVFAVGEGGVTVIAGVAGENVLTITAGDVLLSDASLTMTDADNAATLSVTNNTATTASVFVYAGSGAFTGVTTSSFMTLTASGLTSGTLLRLVANAATTSVGVVDISTTGLTSGSSLRITEATATFTTGARAIEVDLVAATAGNGMTITTTGAYTGTGMVLLTAGAATTGILLSLVSTTGMTSGSLLRMTTSTGGAVATNGICSIRATGAYTSTSNAGLLDVEATATTAGTVVRIAASAAAQTTASLLQVIASGYTTGYTGVVAEITGVGTTGAGTVFRVASAQTTAGTGILLDTNGITTGGVGMSISHTTSVIGAGSSMLRITSTGADTGTTTGCLLDLASSTATAGTLVLVTSATLATGSGQVWALAGLTTGVGFSMTHATAVIASGGSMFRLNSGGIDTATTTGCLVDLTSTASTAGTQVLMTFSGLTTGVGMRMVGNAITSGIMVDLESSLAGFNGLYIDCKSAVATTEFSVGVNGRLAVRGTAGITALTITAGDVTTADGAFAAAIESVTVGAAAATFAVDSNYVRVTGDAGGNSVTTITGGISGQIVVLEFRDALVTIVNDNTDAANTIDLLAGNTTFATDATLTLGFNGTSWKEITRSINA